MVQTKGVMRNEGLGRNRQDFPHLQEYDAFHNMMSLRTEGSLTWDSCTPRRGVRPVEGPLLRLDSHPRLQWVFNHRISVVHRKSGRSATDGRKSRAIRGRMSHSDGCDFVLA